MSLGRMLAKLSTFPTPFGEDVRLVIHWTWYLLVLLIAIRGDWEQVFLTLGLYVIVVLHEFGHCYAARRYNIPIGDIFILPFGGCAQIDMPLPSSKVEWIVTVCGPFVNFALIPILLVLIGATTLLGFSGVSDFLVTLSILNCGMLVFNLLPAFPMDGGRMLRASLHYLWGDVYKATLVSTRITYTIAVTGSLLSVCYGQYLPAFLAIFIAMGSRMELNRIRDFLPDNGEPLKVEVQFVSWTPENSQASGVQISDFVITRQVRSYNGSSTDGIT